MARMHPLLLLFMCMATSDIGECGTQATLTFDGRVHCGNIELNGEAAGIKVVAYEEDVASHDEVVSNTTDFNGFFTVTGKFEDGWDPTNNEVEVFFHVGEEDICKRNIFKDSAFCTTEKCTRYAIYQHPRTVEVKFINNSTGRFEHNIDVCDMKQWMTPRACGYLKGPGR